MKKTITREKLIPYLWATPIFFAISLLNTTHSSFPGTFMEMLLNNVWHIPYVIVLNFILFEYTVPFVLRKRKAIIYNILLGLLLLWVYMMMYSFGGYAWRQLGIALHIY